MAITTPHSQVLYYNKEYPIGWCQCCQRDNFPKLIQRYQLSPDPDMWAITCLLLQPDYRHRGYAHDMLHMILEFLKERGVNRIQAFPRSGFDLPDDDIWTGPESLYIKAGFHVIQSDKDKLVYMKELNFRDSLTN